MSKKEAIIDFVPQNAQIVLKIANFDALKSDSENNSLFSKFKNTDPYLFLSEKAEILKHLNPSGESLLCINKLNDSLTAYTFISKQTPELLVTDSLQNKIIETLNYQNKTIQRLTLKNQVAFTTTVDSVFIVTSSQQLLQNILDGKTETNSTFKKIYNIKNSAELNFILKADRIRQNDSSTLNFASYLALDLEVLPHAINATGVALARDTIPQLLNVFEGLIPQQNDLAQIIPTDALGAISLTYNDPELFQTNIQSYLERDFSNLEVNTLLGAVSEVGKIELQEGTVLVLRSIDPLITSEDLAKYSSQGSSFREVEIDLIDEENFTFELPPIIQNLKSKYVFQLENFFVFTETEQAAQHIITSFKNNDCLNNSAYYKDASSQLSNASSLTIYKTQYNTVQAIASFFKSSIADEMANISLKKFPLAILQFSYDRDFAHVNMVCKEITKENLSSGTVSQVFSLQLDNEIMGVPQFFTNHRTKGKDVVVQDITNKLYFISSSGKVLWTKKLNNPILGEINEVDLLRNGKKQLAFVTKKGFYILDRNGKDVSPFPMKFKDDITQALAVFDYDNKRKYRFLVTQGKELNMYDSKGKIVTGFTFKKASSNVVLPPQHIRMANKDYILIAEEDGKLNILSRTGKSRINISKKFSFSDIPIAKELNKFVIITKDFRKESISQAGKVDPIQLNVADNYWFTMRGNTKVTLDDNLLRISGKLIELPFGIYSRPKAFLINRKTYISVTETQENKVFVFDKEGTLIPGFPVYGTSVSDLGEAKANGQPNMVVKGSAKEVILYQFQ